MSITIPDLDCYKEVDKAITKMAEQERRSKTQMSVILIEEAIEARKSERT